MLAASPEFSFAFAERSLVALTKPSYVKVRGQSPPLVDVVSQVDKIDVLVNNARIVISAARTINVMRRA